MPILNEQRMTAKINSDLDARRKTNKARIAAATMYLTISLVLSVIFTLMHAIATYCAPVLATEKISMWIPMHSLLVVALAILMHSDKGKLRTNLQVLLQHSRVALVAIFLGIDIIVTVYRSISLNQCGAVCQADRTNYIAAFVALPGHILVELGMLIFVVVINMLCAEDEADHIKSSILSQNEGTINLSELNEALALKTGTRLSIYHVLEDKEPEIHAALKSKVNKDTGSTSISIGMTRSTLINRK